MSQRSAGRGPERIRLPEHPDERHHEPRQSAAGAEGELGLVKADPSQITYVQLEDQSIIERNTGAAGRLLDEVRTAALSLLDSLNP